LPESLAFQPCPFGAVMVSPEIRPDKVAAASSPFIRDI